MHQLDKSGNLIHPLVIHVLAGLSMWTPPVSHLLASVLPDGRCARWKYDCAPAGHHPMYIQVCISLTCDILINIYFVPLRFRACNIITTVCL